MAPRIVGYAYDADVHCPSCTRRALYRPSIKCDENSVPLDATDREGNEITPIFDYQEDGEVCGDCGAPLGEV